MARSHPPHGAIAIPASYPTSAIFIDESGSKSTASKCFVMAAIKLREPGLLAREIRDVRDRAGYTSEFKFSRISDGNYAVFCDVVDALAVSDAHIAACVVDGQVHNPFKGAKAAWLVHAEVISQLLVGCMNQRELAGVLLDGISTPPGCSLEDTVRRMTNHRLGGTSIVSAVALDSRTNDLLQAADLVAGSIFHERLRAKGSAAKPGSPRGKIALRLAAAFGRPGLEDGRDSLVNIATYRGRAPRRRPALRVIEGASSTA